MVDPRRKSLRAPDETIAFPGLTESIVEIGGMSVGRVVQEPGWRWSTHVQPTVGGEWCQARHVGLLLSGRVGVTFSDGTTLEFEPDDVFEVPPGHDGYVLGDEPAVSIEWAGLWSIAGGTAATHGRTLAALLFTDLVESTAAAVRMGEVAWRETLAAHYQAARSVLERFRGTEVTTTGDGMLAIFSSPVLAVRGAVAVREAALQAGLDIRAGVHVGEVEVAGTSVQGVSVHEAARIMATAEPGEILVSEVTRTLAALSGLHFNDRGTHELKGLPGERRLFAYAPSPTSEPVTTVE